MFLVLSLTPPTVFCFEPILHLIRRLHWLMDSDWSLPQRFRAENKWRQQQRCCHHHQSAWLVGTNLTSSAVQWTSRWRRCEPLSCCVFNHQVDLFVFWCFCSFKGSTVNKFEFFVFLWSFRGNKLKRKLMRQSHSLFLKGPNANLRTHQSLVLKESGASNVWNFLFKSKLFFISSYRLWISKNLDC